ncbi:MAG TPA: hypothetical protein VGS19_16455 [Streptosporangiaceae bacterium]|nr:hypothetical protein [Streptosporangiaceae bacterium]
MVTSRRKQGSRRGVPARPPGTAKGETAGAALGATSDGDTGDTASGSALPRLAPVRLAPRDELAAAARVSPMLRTATDVARWAVPRRGVTEDGCLHPGDAAAAASDLELTLAELGSAWRVAAKTGMVSMAEATALPGGRIDVLTSGTTDDILAVWDDALRLLLAAEDLDGLATALYTVSEPVKMEALFDAYMTAASAAPSSAPGEPSAGAAGNGQAAADLSAALEELADLGVVELGTDDSEGGLTVALSPLGVWGIHRHLREQGWHVPVLGTGARGDAAALLTTLAGCDVEDGEAEIASWLAARAPGQAARELVAAARNGTPGLRGAAFAVLDRVGPDAVPVAREALGDPEVGAHAAVWLREHGEEADLQPEDRAWLLVDLGAGLLEEADPKDVVVELLPDLPGEAQADLVATLWRVDHPAVTDLLTALSNHHPDPAVARAARKASFKARSLAAASRRRRTGPRKSLD